MPAALLTIFTNKWVLGAIGIGMLLLAIEVQTLRLNHVSKELASLKAQEAAAAAHSKQVAKTQATITKAVSGHQAAAQARIVYVTRTLHDQVAVAVPPPVDVFLNNGFVRLHDAAAIGVPALPPAAGKPDAAASTVKTSVALAGIIDNYGTCHTAIARLSDLQSWVSQVTAAQ